MKNPVSISIILPVYNEEDTIEQTVADSVAWLSTCEHVEAYELVAVNDGSIDASGKILATLKSKYPQLVVIDYQQNKGYGGALITGIRQAEFDWILLMDSDGQFKINALDSLWEFIDDYDIIAGFRAQRQDNAFRIWLGELYTRLASTFLKVRLRDINCGFKLFRKSFLRVENIHTHAGAFYTHVFMNAQAQNARIKEIAVKHHPRVGGRPTGASLKVVMMAISDFFGLLFRRGPR